MTIDEVPMSTRAIKRKHDPGAEGAGRFQAPPETAPSLVRADQPTVVRGVAFVALLAASVGGMVLIRSAFGGTPLIGPAWGVFFLAVGLGGLLYHAAAEKDVQYRRIYGVAGAALVASGVLFSLLPFREEVGYLFLPAGVPCLLLGLVFLLAFARNETDTLLHALVERLLGGLGGGMALVGAIGGLINEGFFLGMGLVMLVLGLFYLAGFVGLQRPGSERGYLAGLAMGGLGLVMVAIPVGRLFLPAVFGFPNWGAGQPGPPVLYFYVGLEYLLLSIGICSDAKVVVLARRELAAYFYSPIAYVVLIAMGLLGGLSFLFFVNELVAYSRETSSGIPEPIFYVRFIIEVLPVVSIMVAVPVITMRLLSEEQRTGTLEVLLTAPVNEWSVVVSKFLAALRFFLLLWYPWGLYLIALRIEGREEFDYRPLLSFAIVLLVTGANFVSMGVFFSSVTRNQVASAILTFMGMMVLLGFTLFKGMVGEGALRTVLTYASFLDLWIESLQGNLSPRFLVFHLSAAVLWLFLTVKVLEARKWR
jgi:ABC-type transport system involved in multi-copper enzyme maturation permease subunit